MTAMMAFFLVMWLLSIASPQELTRVAEYFRTPLKAAIEKRRVSGDVQNPILGEDVILCITKVMYCQKVRRR